MTESDRRQLFDQFTRDGIAHLNAAATMVAWLAYTEPTASCAEEAHRIFLQLKQAIQEIEKITQPLLSSKKQFPMPEVHEVEMSLDY